MNSLKQPQRQEARLLSILKALAALLLLSMSALVSAQTPTTNTWEVAGGLITPRYFHTSTLLPSGKVLVAGGSDGNAQKSSLIFRAQQLPLGKYLGRIII